MTNIKNIVNFGILAIFLAISIVAIQQVYATGCPTNFVSEHIKNAKDSTRKRKYRRSYEST